MKYVDWVDRVFKAAAHYADANDRAALYGFSPGVLPRELGFGDAAEQPGYQSEGGLYEAIHDALSDLRDLGIVINDEIHTVKLKPESIGAGDLSISTEWHVLFDEFALTDREAEFMRYLCKPGVGVDEQPGWGRRLWVGTDAVLEGLGWSLDDDKVRRLVADLDRKNAIEARMYGGSLGKMHPTYIGIVVATEQARFVKKPVPQGAPTCFISYSHADQRLARDIAHGLQNADLGVEIDEAILAGGDSLVDKLAEATARVNFVIALVSRNSVDSHWCKYEVALAMSDEVVLGGAKVIPVRVGKVEMPVTLRHKVYRDANKLGTDGLIDQLVRDIRTHQGRTPSDAAGLARET